MTEQEQKAFDQMREALEHIQRCIGFDKATIHQGSATWCEIDDAIAAANAVSVEPQEPAITWPQDAAEIREFIGSNFNSRTEDGEPSDDDKYSLTAHDLLSAFSDWVEFVDMDALRARRAAVIATSQEQRDWCLTWHDRKATKSQAQGEATEAERVCYEAYQVVGCLLSDAGRFETSESIKILDNLSQAKMIHTDVLPWLPHPKATEPVSKK